MRKILLDCGTHYGQGIKELNEIYYFSQGWKIFTWEANPYTYDHFNKIEKFKNFDIVSFNQAISTYNGKIQLNLETKTNKKNEIVHEGQGTSVIPLELWNSPKHSGTFINSIDVECIDFAQWMQENLQDDDFVVLKMDIEGAEYDVMDHLITTNAINYINDIYIEWHSRFFQDRAPYLEKESKIAGKLKNLNIKIGKWH